MGAFPDGTWLVELSWLQDRDLLAHLVAEALWVTDQTMRPMMEVVLEFLARRQLLLILDGAEHMRERCTQFAGAVLGTAPGVRIVVTSRQPLNVPGERVLVVHPLPVPGSPEAGPDTKTPDMKVPEMKTENGWCESVALFADRAAAVVPGFTITGANQAEVARLCRRIDGLPLAIELAAAQLRDLSARQIADRLDDRLGLLASPHVGGLPRHQAMRAAIGWSHELCEPAERLMWARLSVFHGDFTLGAVQEICSDGHLPAEAITKVLSDLVTKSVMERLNTPAGPRFRMLDTVREYGAEWLRRLHGNEAERLRRRHRDYYIQLAEAGERQWFSPYQSDTFQRTQAEYANLRAAVEFSLTTAGEVQAGLRLAGTLWFYWVGCGHLGAGRQLLDRALALDPEPTPLRIGLRLEALIPPRRSPPIGLRPDPTLQRARLAAGERILFYTDGLAEARDAKGEMFRADEGIADALTAPLLEDAVEGLLQLALTHTGGEFHDDLTLVLAQPADDRDTASRSDSLPGQDEEPRQEEGEGAVGTSGAA